MAQLDIKGFVTPEQEFAGLYKLGDTLQAQQAARQKEKAAQDANKKLLNKVVEDIDPKDFISSTIIDGKTSNDIYELKQKANEAIAQSKGNLDQATFNQWLAPQIAKIASNVQNAKELKRQADKGAEELKTIPGFDSAKYYEGWNKYFMNPDGTIKRSVDIDPTKNYYDEVVNNGNIWTSQAIHSALDKLPTVTHSDIYDVTDSKGKKYKTQKELTYNPTFYQPKIEGTEFQGWQPDTDYVTLDNVKDKTQPILGHNAWSYLTSDPKTSGYIKQRMREISAEKGYNMADPQQYVKTENEVRKELWNLVDTSPYKKASDKNLLQTSTVVKNYMGGKGEGEVNFKDIYNNTIDAFKKGLKSQSQEAVRANRLNINDLDIAEANAITKAANDRNQGRDKKYNASDLILIASGDMKGYDIIDKDGNKVMPFNDSKSINPMANYGTKTKQAAATISTNKPVSQKTPLGKKVTNAALIAELNKNQKK